MLSSVNHVNMRLFVILLIQLPFAHLTRLSAWNHFESITCAHVHILLKTIRLNSVECFLSINIFLFLSRLFSIPIARTKMRWLVCVEWTIRIKKTISLLIWSLLYIPVTALYLIWWIDVRFKLSYFSLPFFHDLTLI